MEETLIKKIMPHSIEAEQSVIGSMLMDEEAIEIASEIVTEDDFYGNQYKLLYKAIQNLHKEGSAVDIVTLQERLKAMDVPEQFMSIKFLRDIVSAVPISGNVKEYAKIIKEKATHMKKKTLVFMMIDILIGKMIFNCLILFLIAYDYFEDCYDNLVDLDAFILFVNGDFRAS